MPEFNLDPKDPFLKASLAIETSPASLFIRLDELDARVLSCEAAPTAFFFGVDSSDLSKSVFDRERFRLGREPL